MKKDRLLQHQLARLDRMIKAYPYGFTLPGDKVWLERAMSIYSSAINRSLRRHVVNL